MYHTLDMRHCSFEKVFIRNIFLIIGIVVSTISKHIFLLSNLGTTGFALMISRTSLNSTSCNAIKRRPHKVCHFWFLWAINPILKWILDLIDLILLISDLIFNTSRWLLANQSLFMRLCKPCAIQSMEEPFISYMVSKRSIAFFRWPLYPWQKIWTLKANQIQLRYRESFPLTSFQSFSHPTRT